MPLYHIIHRDPANREIIATEEPIDAPDQQSALLLFMGLMLGKSGAEIASMSGKHLTYEYDAWIRSHGKWAECGLSDRLEVREAERV